MEDPPGRRTQTRARSCGDDQARRRWCGGRGADFQRGLEGAFRVRFFFGVTRSAKFHAALSTRQTAAEFSHLGIHFEKALSNPLLFLRAVRIPREVGLHKRRQLRDLIHDIRWRLGSILPTELRSDGASKNPGMTPIKSIIRTIRFVYGYFPEILVNCRIIILECLWKHKHEVFGTTLRDFEKPLISLF